MQKSISSYTLDELSLIAQIKRFFEVLTFDVKFFEIFENNSSDLFIKNNLAKVGVHFSVKDIKPMLDKKNTEVLVNLIFKTKKSLSKGHDIQNEIMSNPLVQLWVRWLEENIENGQSTNDGLDVKIKNQKFDSWRKRRILAVKSELGHFGNIIDHPIFAYELTSGCSVGCHFCACSANKLSGVYDYNKESQSFWKDILRVSVDLFGKSSEKALCYYGTEPADNPFYLDMIKDFQDVTKGIACTSTAAPFKDIVKFKALVGYYRQYSLPLLQVSILSESTVKKLHDIFTPLDLLFVTLVDQTHKTDNKKVIAGKVMNWDRPEINAFNGTSKKGHILPQVSASCLSGFLVNMVNFTIKLISPCKATPQYPYGYRIFAETMFKGVKDYKDKIEQIINKYMKDSVDPAGKLKFRDDLMYEPSEEGFKVKSFYQTHSFSGGSSLKQLGDLLAEGNCTYEEALFVLRQKGTNPVQFSFMVKNLYDQGFLDEKTGE